MIERADFPKNQKCKYCQAPATKRIIHSEGMAYVPTCDKHLDKGKDAAARCLSHGGKDMGNIDAVRDVEKAGNDAADKSLWASCVAAAKAKFQVYPCVPLDSQALTRRGWVGPAELAVGDEIMAYDVEKDVMRWTSVLEVHRHDDAPVIAWTNAQSRWTLRSTPDHNWVMFKPGAFEPRDANPGALDHRQGRARQGRRLTPIDSAPRGVWNVLVAAPLALDEPGVDLTMFTKYGQSWVEAVLRMNRDQLQAWVAAAIVYDGHEAKSSFGFSQKDSDHLMALELAAALTGHVVIEARYDDRSVTSVSVLRRRHIQIQQATRVELERQSVWCPQTAYGTWLMRQDGFITITGNSAYANGWAVQEYKRRGGKWRESSSEDDRVPAGWAGWDVEGATKDEGLGKWFAEKWVDISRTNADGSHPACGRPTAGMSAADYRKSYPKCVPASKAAGMSSGEKKSASDRKRDASNASGDGKGQAPTRVSTEKSAANRREDIRRRHTPHLGRGDA